MDSEIDALLFDLGGVILNIDVNRVYARWAHHSGADAAVMQSRLAYDETYKRYERDEIGLAEYFNHLRAKMDLDLSDELMLDGWNDIYLGEMPAIGEVLEAAGRRLPLYAFSNTNKAHVAAWLPRYERLMTHFRTVFISSTIGLRKPERAAFDHVVAAIGVPAGRILFFDDVLENVEGARAAGLQAVQVTDDATVADTLWSRGLIQSKPTSI